MTSEAQKEAREALDQIIRDADGYWPVARDAILALMDEASRAPQPTEDGYVIPCARCGVRKVITRTPLNDDLDVCGDCGVQIGLTELQPQPTEDEPLNVERENAAADYVRRNVGGMQPVMTVGERVHDAFVSGAEWAAGFRRAPAEPAVQGEPTDAQVEAAAMAWSSGSPTPNNWENMTSRLQGITKDRMRAALRAAFATRGEAMTAEGIPFVAVGDRWLAVYTAEKQAEARRDVILHDVRKAVGMALAFVPWPRVGEEYDATPMVDALTKELFEAQRLREQATNQVNGGQ